jgi:hypothetical protein
MILQLLLLFFILLLLLFFVFVVAAVVFVVAAAIVVVIVPRAVFHPHKHLLSLLHFWCCGFGSIITSASFNKADIANIMVEWSALCFILGTS